MKTVYVLAALLWSLCIATPSNAQVHLGAFAGLNRASLSGDEMSFTGSRTALALGGVFDYDLSKRIALRLQPMYLRKGMRGQLTAQNGFTGEIDWKLTYVEIPVMLKFVAKDSGFKPYLLAGASVGMNLSSKEKNDGNLKDITRSMDIGLDLGAGVSVPLGENSIFVEARYAPGLMNILEESDVKTRGFQIFAGFTFLR